MPDPGLHFAQPWWLLGLIAPLLFWLWLRFSAPRRHADRYKIYADSHLLPALLGERDGVQGFDLRRFKLWILLWSLAMLALASPRWGYHEVQVFRPGSDLVILLDLSRSMDATDLNPSRIGRARQEVQDILEQARGVRIALVGFASVAHVVGPLSSDTGSLRLALPALNTELVALKGSRPAEAFGLAEKLLAASPEDSNRHVLLVSDGDFGDDQHQPILERLVAANTQIHVLAMGTAEGATIQTKNGVVRGSDGQPVISRLDEKGLEKVAELGQGLYLQAGFNDDDTAQLLERIERPGGEQEALGDATRVWHEQFHWLVIIAMLAMLPGFRRPGRGEA